MKSSCKPPTGTLHLLKVNGPKIPIKIVPDSNPNYCSCLMVPLPETLVSMVGSSPEASLGSFLCSRTQQSSLPWSHGFPGNSLIILCSCLIKLPPLLFIFTGKCQPYAQCLLRFVQGRVGVSALPEVFNVSEPSSADLCHALSSVCFAKQLSTTEVEHPCREGASALERLQRKKKNRKKTNMYFCSSKLNKHIFNHTLL